MEVTIMFVIQNVDIIIDKMIQKYLRYVLKVQINVQKIIHIKAQHKLDNVQKLVIKMNT